MSFAARRLTEDDLDQVQRLSGEAFGMPDGTPPPAPRPWPRPGQHPWGAFDGGELVAVVIGREYHSWWGGVEVPTTGIAAVSVAAERRGTGLLAGPMRAVLSEGRARGEAISTLYPTAPGIYRRFGYEVVTELTEVELPTASLGAVRAPGEGLRLRRAGPADVPAIQAVYDAWAAAQNGPLSRRGPSFPTADPLSHHTGVTVAMDEADRVVGYLSWTRGQGYDAAAAISVGDLLALDGRAHPLLWRFLGGFASVAPTVRLRTSGDDLARLWLPSAAWKIARRDLYMLHVSDVSAALAARPTAVTAELSFGVDETRFELVAADGRIVVTPLSGARDVPTFAARGLSLLYAGVQTCATLRLAGLLTGPTAYDATLDALLDHRPVHVRDYF